MKLSYLPIGRLIRGNLAHDSKMKINIYKFLIWASLWCGGCRPAPSRNYNSEHVIVGRSLLIPCQFDKLYNDCDHFITGYPSQAVQIWNSETFLYGRYILSCQIEMKYSPAGGWTKAKEATFHLEEVSKIYLHSGGATEADMGESYEFGEAEWAAIEKRFGDLSQSGFKVLTNLPVRNFDAFVQGIRRPRIPVSLK